MSSLLLADLPVQSDFYFWLTAGVVALAIVAFVIVVVVVNKYRVCASNRVLVIYGKAGSGKDAAPASTAGRGSSCR